MKFRFPWRRRADGSGEPVTAELPPPTDATGSSQAPLEPAGGLAEPPLIGRVAENWEQHLSSSPWRRPSLTADSGVIGGWVVAAASVLGRTHAHRADGRQDAYGLTVSHQTLVCAVADGVSGAVLGAPAADVAVAGALRAIDSQTGDATDATIELVHLEHAVGQARSAVDDLANRLELDPAQCATTLLLAAVGLGRGSSIDASVVSVGDSSVIELRPDASVEVLLGPRPGESSRKLEDYLPRAASAVQRRRVSARRGSALLLATDGLARDLCQSPTVREWVVAQLRRADTPVGAAHVLSYRRQRSSDDLTFVALAPQQWR